MKRKLIINGKEYEMPKMDVDTYMEYLEVRDDIMGTEKKSGLYTAEQFRKMLDCICMVYGNQFTVDELKDKDTGLSLLSWERGLKLQRMQDCPAHFRRSSRGSVD